MGILDDAIRQHLDLKRRLGAGEDELARLEDEAFGLPTRPGDPDFPETGSEPVQQAEGTIASLQEGEERSEQPPAPDPIAEISEPTTPPTSGVDTVEHQISLEPDDDDIGSYDGEEQEAERDPSAGEVTDAPDAKSATGEQAAPEDPGEAEVVEGELEEPAAEPGEQEDDGAADEDVLEETPEFLRDQPEDDELWFEQGEPKDFDF